MKRFGPSGGLLGINSFVQKEKQAQALNTCVQLRTATASVFIKEASSKSGGELSLYPEVEEVIDFYKDKDFDILEAIKERSNGNFIWVRARAIDADTVNANGDYFSKAELLKEVTVKKGSKDEAKIPAYKTFEGVPIYTNHENKDIQKAKGKVIFAEWDEEENCVYCTFIVNADAYPDIVDNIRHTIIHDVSMGCFPAGTRVLTDNGYKFIEYVSLDDKLIDEKGNFVDIVNKQIHEYNGDVIKIEAEGGISFEATVEHPFLVYTPEMWKNRHKRVGTGKERYYVSNNISPIWKTAEELHKGDRLVTPTGGEVLQDADFTYEKARIVGYFLAEGNFLKRNNKLVETEFSFALNEENTLAQETINLIETAFSLNVRKYNRIDRNICVLRITSEDFANWLYEQCNQYSDSKKLHNKWLFAPLKIQKELLGAWLNGDGNLHKVPSKPNANSIDGATISRTLFQQLSWMLFRCGINHSKGATINTKHMSFSDSLKYSDKFIGDNGKKVAYHTQIASSYARDLVDVTDFHGVYTQQHKGNTYDNWIVKPITKITKHAFNDLVFNFETKNHTYIVEDFVCHNCSVQEGVCSECNNKATTENEYCKCLQTYKGRKHPSTGKIVYEKNYGIKFIELSLVGDGAFETCEIQAIFEPNDMLRKASNIKALVFAAASSLPKDTQKRHELETYCRYTVACTNNLIRLAQSAGTLVGGQVLATEGADQNTTVQKILTYLGIDGAAGLNVLDMLNLALNFLEVAVMNLFARKDNIDLSHVGKITKSMADLQAAMQDMLDDGVDTGGGNQQAPINQGQFGQNPAQTPPNMQGQGQQTPNANYTPAGDVGRMMAPNTQQNAFQANAVGPSVMLADRDNENIRLSQYVLCDKNGLPKVVWGGKKK